MSTKSKPRPTWREKLEKEQEPKMVNVPPKWQKRYGTGTMLIARPLDVDALIGKVQKGKLVTQTQIREKLAKDFNTDTTCPLTTGIFIRIVAETAEEDLRMGRKNPITPYWRVVKNDGGLNEKFPGGAQAQAERLTEEGHIIEPGKGKKPPRVKDFEESLQTLL